MPKVKKKRKLTKVMGIDPGKSGGIVVLDVRGGVVLMEEMPTTYRDIFKLLDQDVEFCYIEWIHPAIQGAAKSAMSKLYGNYCALQMALTGNAIRHNTVMPKKWQQHFEIPKRGGLTKTKWKDVLKGKAEQIFPELDVWDQTLTKQRTVCDALLIAEYTRREICLSSPK